jgi:hypothetical protein
MTREDIIRMAREAELHCHVKLTEHGLIIEDLQYFANLVAAAERKRCAQIVQSYMDNEHIEDPGWNVCRDILNDIRAREGK